MERRRTAGAHILWRSPDRPLETSGSADGRRQVIGKGRHISTGDVDIQIEHGRVTVGHDGPADAEILAVDAAFDTRQGNILGRQSGMTFQAIHIESLDSDMAVGHIGLAGQEKAVMTVGDAHLDVLYSPAANDDIGRRRDERRGVGPIDSIGAEGEVILAVRGIRTVGRDLLSIDGHGRIDSHGRISGKGDAAVDVLPHDGRTVRQHSINGSVVDVDGPAEAGIGLALVFLDERGHVPRTVVFILPQVQDRIVDVSRIQGLQDFALLQGIHDFSGIDVDPDGIPFDDDPPLCISNDRLGQDQLAFQGYIQ